MAKPERLKPGIYTEKCSLETRLRLNGELRAAAAKIYKKRIEEENKAREALWHHWWIPYRNYA